MYILLNRTKKRTKKKDKKRIKKNKNTRTHTTHMTIYDNFITHTQNRVRYNIRGGHATPAPTHIGKYKVKKSKSKTVYLTYIQILVNTQYKN